MAFVDDDSSVSVNKRPDLTHTIHLMVYYIGKDVKMILEVQFCIQLDTVPKYLKQVTYSMSLLPIIMLGTFTYFFKVKTNDLVLSEFKVNVLKQTIYKISKGLVVRYLRQ